MSTINTSSIATDTSLARSGLEPLGTDRSIEQLRGRDASIGLDEPGFESFDATSFDGAPFTLTDSGEDVLNASAWSDVPEGDRMLSGDTGFEASLGNLPLSQAADSAADAVFEALF